MLENTTVFNIDDKKKCFTKSAYYPKGSWDTKVVLQLQSVMKFKT